MRRPPLFAVSLVLFSALGIAHAQDAPEASAAPVELASPNPLSGLSLESLEATRSLPLFTPSRTAPSVEEPVVEVETGPVEPVVESETPPPVQLVGILMTGESATALLLDPGSNEVHRLASGEEYEGWSVNIVDSRSVELRSGDRVQDLKMFQSFASPPPMMMEGEMPAEVYPPDVMPGDVQEGTFSEEPPPEATGTVEGEPLPPVQFDPEVGNSGIPEEGEAPPEEPPPQN